MVMAMSNILIWVTMATMESTTVDIMIMAAGSRKEEEIKYLICLIIQKYGTYWQLLVIDLF